MYVQIACTISDRTSRDLVTFVKLKSLLCPVSESILEGLIDQFASAQKARAEVFFLPYPNMDCTLMATDVNFADFDPQTSSFTFLSNLRQRAHALGGHSGITVDQLKAICVRCSRCKRLLSRTSHQYHECPVGETLEECNDDNIFNNPQYRLDAVGEGAALHGLDQETFENLFFKCVDCDHVVTATGRNYHKCPFPFEY